MNKNKIVTTAIFILLLPIGYHFLFTVPQNTNLQNSIDCREVAARVYREDMKNLYEDEQQYQVEEPRFSYVKGLNSCLYSGGYRIYFYQKEGMKEGHDSVTRVIKDVYTNKILTSTYTGFFDVDDAQFKEEQIRKIDEYQELYSKYFK